MPICCVKGCKSKSNHPSRDKLHFFRFVRLLQDAPGKKHRSLERNELAKKRYKKWCQTLNLNESERVLRHAFICGHHFLSGHPAKLMDVKNSDWIPSLNLHEEKGRAVKKKPHRIANKNMKTEENLGINLSDIDSDDTISAYIMDGAEIKLGDHDNYYSKSRRDSDAEFDDQDDDDEEEEYEDLEYIEDSKEVITDTRSNVEQINRKLEEEVRRMKLSEETILKNPARCQLFTGLNNLVCKSLFERIKKDLPLVSGSYVKQWETFIITLYKLRMNHSFEYIEDQFQLDHKILMTLFYHCINCIHEKFRGNISWPLREQNIHGKPEVLKNVIADKFTMIVDCLEMITKETDHSLNRKLQTRKFIVGISTNDYICFVSEGFPSTCNNLDLLYKSGFLDLLHDGDIILGDSNFFENSGEESLKVELYQKVNPTEITPFIIEEPKLKSVVEFSVLRTLGIFKKKYEILNKNRPLILPKGNSINLIDQVVIACCCLMNMAHLTVPTTNLKIKTNTI